MDPFSIQEALPPEAAAAAVLQHPPTGRVKNIRERVKRRLATLSRRYAMKWLLGLLTVVFFALQARLWGGDGSFAELAQLRAAIEHQQRDNATFRDRNDALAAEVKDLKEGLDAVEERARRELGMIKDGEVFFQIVDR